MNTRIISTIAILVGVTASSLSVAQEEGQLKPKFRWFSEDQAIGKLPEHQAVAGSLGVMQLLVDDIEKAFEAWDQPTAGVSLDTTSHTVLNDPIFSIVIFSGCASDDKGNCNLSADIKVLAPSGVIYSESEETNIWVNLPAPDEGVLQMGIDTLGLAIERGEELGEYVIESTVRDNIAKTKTFTVQRFSVTAQ